MKKVKALLQEGKLTEAILYLEKNLRDDPKNTEFRSAFVELLCLNGELERADNQLNMMVKQNPDFVIGAVNLRHLIRAEQSRQDFYQGAASPDLFSEADAQVETLLKLRLALNENDLAQAEQYALQLETLRLPVDMEFNGKKITDIRDLDDSLCGFLELFGTDGKYYLAKFSEIDNIEIQPVSSIMEIVWRKVEISIKDGPSGEAYLPLTYAGSQSEAEKLGKETDWNEHSQQFVTGLGLKMLYIDEQAHILSDVQSLAALTEEV